MLSAVHEERLARNEAFFREVNERINETAADLAANAKHAFEYLCECADARCTDRVPMTLAEYEAVRSGPKRFVVAPGHQVPEIEQVVAADAERVVVEKNGLAGKIAVQLDPRSA